MPLTQAETVNVLILAILTYSLALPLRAGLLSLAPIVMAGIGGYTTALLMLRQDTNVVLAVGAAVVGGCLLSAVLAAPLARLQGLYTSIGTLAFLIMARALEQTFAFTGGSVGLYGIPHHDMIIASAAVLLSAVGLFYWIDHSGVGRRMDLVGDDEGLAMSLGIRPVRYRVLTQVVAGGFAGYAGAAFVNSYYIMTPDIFEFYFAVQVVAFLFVGGARHWIGPLLGSACLGALTVGFDSLLHWRDVIAGALMVVVLIVYPEGMGGALRSAFRYRGFIRRRLRQGRVRPPVDPEVVAAGE